MSVEPNEVLKKMQKDPQEALKVIRQYPPLERYLYSQVDVRDKDVIEWLTKRAGGIGLRLLAENKIEEVAKLADRYRVIPRKKIP